MKVTRSLFSVSPKANRQRLPFVYISRKTDLKKHAPCLASLLWHLRLWYPQSWNKEVSFFESWLGILEKENSSWVSHVREIRRRVGYKCADIFYSYSLISWKTPCCHWFLGLQSYPGAAAPVNGLSPSWYLGNPLFSSVQSKAHDTVSDEGLTAVAYPHHQS